MPECYEEGMSHLVYGVVNNIMKSIIITLHSIIEGVSFIVTWTIFFLNLPLNMRVIGNTGT